MATIDRYRILEDSDREELRGLVGLAAQICATPMATITVFGATEQHHVAAHGFEGVVVPLEDSLCLQFGTSPKPRWVPDAREDPRTSGNVFIPQAGPGIRLFATEELIDPDGVVFGSLCVADVVARDLSSDQLSALNVLAERVVDSLELHVRTHELAASLERAERIRDELRSSNIRLQEFAAQVSHDLKTPLTSMSLSLELAREQIEDDQSADDTLWLLDRAIRGSTRMGEFIDRNLEFAAIAGGLRTRDVDLGGLVDNVLVDLGGALADVEVTVDHLPVVDVDPVQLRAVIQNLVHNASKFRHPERRPEVSISSRRTTTGWRLQVQDNGSGLTDEERVRVFEPHVRAHQDVSGTGLGLDTCRRLIEAHGGSIGLDPNPAGGTIAWFELPD